MAKGNARILYVKGELLKGVSRAIIVQYCSKKYKVGPRIVDRYIREAKDLIEADKRDQERILQEAKAAELEALKEEIMTEIELDVLLTRIARGQIVTKKVVWDGAMEKFVQVDDWPSHRDRIAAAQELFKRKGSYAPTKSKTTLEIEGYDVIVPGEEEEVDDEADQD